MLQEHLSAESLRFKPLGDCAISVQVGQVISLDVNKMIRGLLRQLTGMEGIRELAPTYVSVTVYYDPCTWSYSALCERIREVAREAKEVGGADTARIVELPTCYGGEFGQDLAHVAAHNGITEEEVIQRHTGYDYLVYMLGFLPGFAYLGGMDPAIATPRLSNPRPFIAKGSVGIAGTQTGTYPSDSPGGWQIIGRTPVPLYDEDKGALLRAGDFVRYVAISRDDYERMLLTVTRDDVVIREVPEKEVRTYQES